MAFKRFLNRPNLALIVFFAVFPTILGAYDRSEILKILMEGIRSHNPRIQRSVLLLRQKQLLQGWSRTLPELATKAEDPAVMDSLIYLRRMGILSDVKLTPRALSEYLGRLASLDAEEGFEGFDEPIIRFGKLLRDAPFFVRLPGEEVYILGGIALEGTQVEMTYQRPDGFVNVVLPNISRAFIRRSNLIESTPSATGYSQDPDDVLVHTKGPFASYQAHHRGSILSVIKVKLDEDFQHTVVPGVIRRFDLRNLQEEPSQYVHDLARRMGALGAVNGTFFVMMPGTKDDTKPLAPIIIDGRIAWSYREERVLKMGRCYLAITDHNRAFIGETELTAEQIMEAHALRQFATKQLGGERLKHLIGGFGWLVRNGDAEGYRHGVRRQFAMSYYSLMVRRPQTVCAVSKDGRTIWFLVQEGMPHSNEPMPLPELARYVQQNFRCWNAVFFDGGGSSQMVVHGQSVTATENRGPYRKNSTIVAVKGPVFIPRAESFPRIDGR